MPAVVGTGPGGVRVAAGPDGVSVMAGLADGVEGVPEAHPATRMATAVPTASVAAALGCRITSDSPEPPVVGTSLTGLGREQKSRRNTSAAAPVRAQAPSDRSRLAVTA
jgi:hypothetical protein